MPGKWSQVRLYRTASLHDEELCARWLISTEIIPRGGFCHRHKVERGLHFPSDRPAYWSCGKCNTRIAITKGTLFEDKTLSFGKACMLMLCFAKEMSWEATQEACIFSGGEEQLVSRCTIAHWFSLLRQVVVDHYHNKMVDDSPIGGPGVIVQIDEAKIGRRKYNRGRVAEGYWVLGMLDAHGEVRMEVCEDRGSSTLSAIIMRNVLPGSIIHTDEWRAYRCLEGLGYSHATVNHSREFVALDGVHTQGIENRWRQLRRRISPGGKRHEDAADILAEWCWREHVRRNGIDQFAALVSILRP